MKVGDLVAYYLNGWHHGYLVEIRGKLATVQPIRYKTKPRTVTVNVEDIKEEQS